MKERYKITIESWDKVASLYEKKFMDLSIYNDGYDAFLHYLKPKKVKLLEIGCGPGNTSKYLLSKKPDLHLLGIDASSTMVELARKNNPTAQFKKMDARDLSSLKNGYDAILSGFCLPYLAKEDIENIAVESHRLLKENGLAYFSCIEGEYENSGFQNGSTGHQSYVYYYSRSFLKQLFNEANFTLLEELHVDYKKLDGKKERHLVFILRKS